MKRREFIRAVGAILPIAVATPDVIRAAQGPKTAFSIHEIFALASDEELEACWESSQLARDVWSGGQQPTQAVIGGVLMKTKHHEPG